MDLDGQVLKAAAFCDTSSGNVYIRARRHLGTSSESVVITDCALLVQARRRAKKKKTVDDDG